MKLNYPLTQKGLYILKNGDYDDIATDFLREYLPSALERPQAVDIDYLATECLFLDIKEANITVEKSILGMIAFGDTEVECYDLAYKPEVMHLAEGTMLIDVCLRGEGNLPRQRFTKAHEVGHWIDHRTYHSPDKRRYEFRANPLVVCRSSQVERYSYDTNEKTPEEWMELQADKTAAAILMPKEPFLDECRSAMRWAGLSTRCLIVGEHKAQSREAIERIADTFEVSKKATQIRMKQLGLIMTSEQYYNECFSI